jgi:hypothetical protein
VIPEGRARRMVVAYLLGLWRAIFDHKMRWWISLFIASILQIGFFAEYAGIRTKINELLGREMLPETIALWLIVATFFLWVFANLIHDAAKRRISLKVTFDPAEMRCIHDYTDREGYRHRQYRMQVINETGNTLDNCRGFVNEICEPDGNGGWRTIFGEQVALTWAEPHNITEMKLNDGQPLPLNLLEIRDKSLPVMIAKTDSPFSIYKPFKERGKYRIRAIVCSDSTATKELYFSFIWDGTINSAAVSKVSRRYKSREERYALFH